MNIINIIKGLFKLNKQENSISIPEHFVKITEIDNIEIISNNISNLKLPKEVKIEDKRDSYNLTYLNNISKASVLGVDILGYSQYKAPDQLFIPFIFYHLLNDTISEILKFETFIFQGYNWEIVKERFIATGDGGFIIFNNPLESILFSLYFECSLRKFNAKKIYSEISEYTGPLKIRYSITFDEIYKAIDQKNYFGTGIINNARMLARDKLDRCLIDENTINWFLEHTNGIESLRNIPFNRLCDLSIFKNYSKNNDSLDLDSYAFPTDKIENEPGIDLIIIMKLGTITVKTNKVSIYNLLIQMPYKLEYENGELEYYVVTLGNNNSEGINSDNK